MCPSGKNRNLHISQWRSSQYTNMLLFFKMRDYQKEVVSYTHGTGKLFCSLKGYAPCKNQDEVVQNIGYDPEADLENPTGSVFCAHGAGFVVPWDQVEAYMHLQSGVDMDELDSESWYEDVGSAQNPGTAVDNANISGNISGKNGKFSYSGSYEEEEELQAIFERTFGPMKRDRTAFQKKTVHSSTPATRYRAGKPRQEEYLLVDGYNIIFSWEELNELAKENIHAACDKLMDILSNYQGYRKCTLILVFDAYKVEGHVEEIIPFFPLIFLEMFALSTTVPGFCALSTSSYQLLLSSSSISTPLCRCI